MTSAFDPDTDLADRPATPSRGAAPMPYRPRPSRWARVFRWWLGLSAVVLLGVAVCAAIGLVQTDFAPLHVVIHGDDLFDGMSIDGIDQGQGALLAAGLALLALFLFLMIPALLVLLVGSVAIALVCGVGVPLVVLALVLGVVTSPFWLVGLLAWMIARRRDSHRLAGSARMAA